MILEIDFLNVDARLTRREDSFPRPGFNLLICTNAHGSKHEGGNDSDLWKHFSLILARFCRGKGRKLTAEGWKVLGELELLADLKRVKPQLPTRR